MVSRKPAVLLSGPNVNRDINCDLTALKTPHPRKHGFIVNEVLVEDGVFFFCERRKYHSGEIGKAAHQCGFAIGTPLAFLRIVFLTFIPGWSRVKEEVQYGAGRSEGDLEYGGSAREATAFARIQARDGTHGQGSR